jgi:hypothetical protein
MDRDSIAEIAAAFGSEARARRERRATLVAAALQRGLLAATFAADYH